MNTRNLDFVRTADCRHYLQIGELKKADSPNPEPDIQKPTPKCKVHRQAVLKDELDRIITIAAKNGEAKGTSTTPKTEEYKVHNRADAYDAIVRTGGVATGKTGRGIRQSATNGNKIEGTVSGWGENRCKWRR